MRTDLARDRRESGFTLIELTLAMAIFLIVIGATAQVLVSYYVGLDVQRQRDAAVNHCVSVISDMRAVRDANPTGFPGMIVAQWPNGATIPDAGTLTGETVVVSYVDPNANPLEITVTSNFRDLRQRPIAVSTTTLLTDR